MDGDRTEADYAVAALLPAWPDRTSRAAGEPLPAWRTPNGFLCERPHNTYSFDGYRYGYGYPRGLYTAVLGEDGKILYWQYGATTHRFMGMSDVFCRRYIIAQNVYHDGATLHFPSECYEIACESWNTSYTDPEDLDTQADSVCLYEDRRPFVAPVGDEDLCEGYSRIYTYPPKRVGASVVTDAGRKVAIWSVQDDEHVVSSQDCTRLFEIMDDYYSSQLPEDHLADHIPPYTAFDIRIYKRVWRLAAWVLTDHPTMWADMNREYEAQFQFTVYQFADAAPKSLEETRT